MAQVLQPAERNAVGRAPELLAIVRDTFLELRRETGAPPGRVTLSSTLDRDLGFDSLARVELLLRVEKAFAVQLGEEVLSSAETVADLLQALRKALQAGGRAAPRRPVRLRPAPARSHDMAAPDEAGTLVEVLEWHARRHPRNVQIVYQADTGEQEICYGDLWQRAQAVAAGLQAHGLAPAQTVAIMLPTCPEYFYTYFGVLIAGGIPVPIYPPARLSQVEEHVRRHAGILANAGTVLLVTVPEARALAHLLKARVPELRAIVTPDELAGAAPVARVPARPQDIAFLQYTSGSTGNPKGVILTHANLLANIRAIGGVVHFGPRDVMVSWLPLYHDMGLISTWLASLYFGRPFVVMSPLAFLARPARWLWAIHQHRGTVSAAPNFAYELCLKRIDDADLAGLDLSSWRVAANGAEQVQPDTIERFERRFAPYGFRAGAMTPCYGLAEATVGLMAPPIGRPPLIDRVRRDEFLRDGRALPASPDDAEALRFVSCGRPLAGHEVRIVDGAGREVGERQEGRLEFKGPSATQGYYRNPEETRRLFDGEWRDSGDRAYCADGEYYITGRNKDIVIRGGHHIHPDEIEQAVGTLAGVRKGCVAVFGSPSPETGTERLVVLAEARAADEPARAALREAIVHATVEKIGEPPDEVVLAPPRTVLKTSSGKIRRSATRDLYQRGRVGARERAGWWQIVRLVGAAALPEARRIARRAAELSYAGYAWIVFALLVPLAWLATALVPGREHAWAMNRLAARLFLGLMRIPVTVEGLRNLPRRGACVLVANHASYVDALILVAVLPRPYAFVAKKEFQRNFFTRLYFGRLGVEFVERFAIRESVADAKRLTRAVRRGTSLAFFPEGTFHASAGLLPFHLGAFVTAVETRTRVVAVALRGTRALLRGNEWFLRRGAVTVRIAAPLAPAAGPAFSAAIRLRDAARARIAAGCGEPDLGAGHAG